MISIGENTLSVEYSDICHVLSNLFPRTRFLLLAKFLSVKIRKTKSCHKFFFMVYMAMNLSLLMITLITKKVSIDGL